MRSAPTQRTRRLRRRPWVLAAGEITFERDARCERCDAVSIVKDGDLTCPECEGPLPADWNVAEPLNGR